MAEPQSRHPIAGPEPAWLRRHRLLWVAPAHHDAVGAEIPDASLRKTVANWLAADRPLVVRQQTDAHARDGQRTRVAVGMPLPRAQGKQRAAFAVAPEWIAHTAPPPFLRDALSRLPESWSAPLLRLVQRADAIDLVLRVFGSVAWESLTGSSYLTPESDVDLLWQPSTRNQLAAAIATLAAWETESGLRADGEILFGDDDAVSWREWMHGDQDKKIASTRVLVKALSGPRLEARAELLASLPTCDTAVCEAA